MVEQLREILDRGRNMVFFGGAGVSTESGIPDFRSADGVFAARRESGVASETLLSYSYFIAHPKECFANYRKNMLYPDAKPNPAHHALSELERRGTLRAVITQNVDGLHQMAGSKTVYELHGSIRRNYCVACRKQYPMEHILEPGTEDGVPLCTCGGMVRPDIVLYEEALDDAVMAGAIRAIEAADVLIVGGTSLAVVPAAWLIGYFQGETLVLINRTPTSYDRRAQLVLREPIGEVLAAAVG